MNAFKSISQKEILEYIRLITNRIKDTKQKDLEDAIINARNGPILYEYLDYLYKDLNVLSYNNKKFPLIMYPAPKNQRYNIESVLGDLDIGLDEVTESEFELAGQAFLDKIKILSRQIWDDPTYRMIEFDSHDQLRFRCALGSYYNMLKHCDILEFEILHEFGKQDSSFHADFDKFTENLKLRRYLHNREIPFRKPSGRSVAIAISTLIIFAENSSYKALIRKQSSRIAVHQHLLHVIPSLMFQPVLRDYKNEYSIKHNIYREYLEEVFGREDVERGSGQHSYDFFYDDPNLKYLRSLEAVSKARFYFTGVSFNLLNLRPEIHALLLITDPEWIYNHKQSNRIEEMQLDILEINWEFKEGGDLRKTKFERIASMDLTGDLVIPKSLFKPENFIPPGAASLKLGVDVARDELGI